MRGAGATSVRTKSNSALQGFGDQTPIIRELEVQSTLEPVDQQRQADGGPEGASRKIQLLDPSAAERGAGRIQGAKITVPKRVPIVHQMPDDPVHIAKAA